MVKQVLIVYLLIGISLLFSVGSFILFDLSTESDRWNVFLSKE